MRGLKILRINRRVDPVLKAKPLGHRHPRQDLEALKDRRLRNLAVGDQNIAMRPICVCEDPVRRHRLPETEIIERLQPVFHILNVFKNDHVDILANRDLFGQTLGEIS